MMNQFECWHLNGQRVIVHAAQRDYYDFMLGFYRVVATLHDPAQGTIRELPRSMQ